VPSTGASNRTIAFEADILDIVFVEK